MGLYQHDVDQKDLGKTLDGVVESVVNHVGVDVNTASPALLTHVAGIGPKLAEKIVAHRDAARPLPQTRGAARGGRAGAEGLRAGGRLPAHPRTATTRSMPAPSIPRATPSPGSCSGEPA